jgi:hypothetical protein
MAELSNYYQWLNADLLRLLPPDARRIVEVGCAAGALGRVYKERYPAAQYVGIEMNPQAAEQAAKHLDRVVIGNAEHRPEGETAIEPGSVDVIVYGDVLEHLIDPWSLLARHAKWLTPRGQVLACIPNIQHWSVILELLQGQWRYQDSGLLDRTHLRFFTIDSIHSLIGGAGLQLTDVHIRDGRNEAFPQFLEMLRPAVTALNIAPSRFETLTGAYQYVVRAIPASTPMPRRLLVQCALSPPPCDRVRVLEPSRFLDAIPGTRTHATGLNGIDLNFGQQGEEKVFVWQRAALSRDDVLRHQKALLARGYLIVGEMDDDPRHWPELAGNIELTLRSCHCLQTTTEPLAALLRSFTPEVAVFPNQLAHLPPPRQYADHGVTTLFFGAWDREADWPQIMPALNRVLTKYPGGARIKVVHDRGFFDAVKTADKDWHPTCDFPIYCQILGSCDIALLPLVPTPLNAMKSDLKFLESAAHGVAALASPTVYDETIIDGVTGRIFRSEQEFEARLSALIEDRACRQEMAKRAYDYVAASRLLSQHYRRRRDWYLAMRDRLPVLNEQARGRVPEMFVP